MNTANKAHKIILLVLLVVIISSCRVLPAAAPDNSSTDSPDSSSKQTATAVRDISATPEPTGKVEIQQALRLGAVFHDELIETPPAVINRRSPILMGPSEKVEPFNRYVEGIAGYEADEFIRGLAEWEAYPDMPPAPNVFVSGYSVYSANAHLTSLKLEFVVYLTGAAHPFSYVRTVNFDLRANRAISLGELFRSGINYLDFLSTFCEDELSGELGQAFFKEGLAPVEENFQSWGLTREGLVIEFDPYQVAPYSSGPQRVMIPFENLKELLDPEGPSGWVEAPDIEVETGEVPLEWPTPAP
jgi:hypothetical protein